MCGEFCQPISKIAQGQHSARNQCVLLFVCHLVQLIMLCCVAYCRKRLKQASVLYVTGMLWQNYQQKQLHHISFSHKHRLFSGCYDWCSLGFSLNCKWISLKFCQSILCTHVSIRDLESFSFNIFHYLVLKNYCVLGIWSSFVLYRKGSCLEHT